MAEIGLASSSNSEVPVKVPVVVCGYSKSGAPFHEYAFTVAVSANGCLIKLTTPVRDEQLLLLKHVMTGEEILCRVVTHATSENALTRVEVDFVSPSERFWRLAFQAENRSPASQERE
jgi:hypothetical protein